jgi:DegV family protein with EDD domain
MPVAVVTDSTAYLPPGLLPGGLTVVPLHVVLSGITGREGVEIMPAEVASALSARQVSVSTSQPTPGEFAEVYERLFKAGVTGIVSVHLSAALSGTYSGACVAATEAPGPVKVVDSRSIGMGLGFAALAAGAAAAAGKTLDEVRDSASAAIGRTSVFFYVDTLEHLRRGGRVTAASMLLGTALAVKPLLEVADGKIVLRDKVRTAARALDRLAGLATEAAGNGRVALAIHHLAAPERAEWLEHTLADRLGDRVAEVHVSEVGAVVAAHVGPGLAGVVVRRL